MDATKKSVLCDGCRKELVIDTPNPHNWGLRLIPKDYGYNTSGITYAIMDYPPIERAYDFCSHECLAKWINE